MGFNISQYVVPRDKWPQLDPDVRVMEVDTGYLQRSDRRSSPRSRKEYGRLVEALEAHGLVAVRDGRLAGINSRKFQFQERMVDYLTRPYDLKHLDEDLENHQGGWTPGAPYPGAEVARDHGQRFREWLQSQHMPFTAHLPRQPDGQNLPDLKERLFLRVREKGRPKDGETAWPQYNRSRYVPPGLGHLEEGADLLMVALLRIGLSLARMLALGYGLPEDTFTRLMEKAPHLLAPTGANMTRYAHGTVLALAHYDFNGPFTLHLQSNCPGLIAWTADGIPFLVRVPEGCVLVQAGRGLEWMTGGCIMAGFHEVVRLPAADEFVRQRCLGAGRPGIRTTTTLFAHCASDQPLAVLPKFGRTAEQLAQYPDTTFGAYMQEELRALGLEV